MNGTDKILRSKLEKHNIRIQKEHEHASTSSEEHIEEDIVLLFSSDDDIKSTSSSEFEVICTSKVRPKDKRVILQAPRNFLNTPEMTEALDRLKITDNAAAMLAATFVKSCGGDVNDFVLSRSSTRRSRLVNRYNISQDILNEVSKNPPKYIAVHWDGKLTKDRFGEKYEALSIIASGAPNYISGKLLGVQHIQNSAGKAQADATFEMLEMWQLTSLVKTLVFDTTSSNSGWKKRASKLLEESIGTKVFYNACRHHIYELVFGSVWKCIFGKKTTGPENPMFNVFKANWNNIDKSKNFKMLEFTDPWMKTVSERVIKELEFLLVKESQLKEMFIRGDYRECAENTLAILGAIPHETYHPIRPGATHSARWMGPLLYCQKMFMWCNQMNYDDEVIAKLLQINQFIVLFYVPAWLKTSIGCDAPCNEYHFLKDMLTYKEIDSGVGDAAYKKLSKHPWYLLEETVVFSLFSSSSLVDNNKKEEMAAKLLSIPHPTDYRLGVPKTTMVKSVECRTSIVDFLGPQSWFIFDTLDFSASWLSFSAYNWGLDESYQAACTFVKTVKVVNDAAERGVQLNTSYAAILTDNESQRDSLLQVVEQHRLKFPDSRKSTLSIKN